MRTGRGVAACASVALAAACGSGHGGPYSLKGAATVSGTVGGHSLAAQDAISGLESPGDPAFVGGWILITTIPDECALVEVHEKLKSGTQLQLNLGIFSGSGLSPPTVGTYTIYGSDISSHRGRLGGAQFVAADASCAPTTFVEATSGTVTLVRAEDTGYSGIFDLVFATPADHLIGNFATGTCSAFGITPIYQCPP